MYLQRGMRWESEGTCHSTGPVTNSSVSNKMKITEILNQIASGEHLSSFRASGQRMIVIEVPLLIALRKQRTPLESWATKTLDGRGSSIAMSQRCQQRDYWCILANSEPRPCVGKKESSRRS